MAQLITVRLNKSEHQPLGFRLQGGKDFGTPLVVQKVNGGSAAERAGLQAGDALIRVNSSDVYALRHQEAQDAIRAAGPMLELTVQRGGGTWRPTVTPTGSLPRPGSRPLGAAPATVTSTSLKATPQPSRAFGSGHNSVAKPFGYMNGTDSVKSVVNKQYNSPVKMYNDQTIAETLSAQTEVLAGGVLGVNFKKNEKTYDAEKSAVFKVLQEAENDPEPEASHFYSRASVARAGTPCSLHRSHRSRSRTPHVATSPQPQSAAGHPHSPQPPPARTSAGTQTPVPEHRPSLPVGCHQVLPDGTVALGASAAPAAPLPQHPLPVVSDTPYCSECNRYIIGVFVRIKDKNLHVECFKCSTCGSSLKNQGYYNLNGKLYCDIHAKLVARNQAPSTNLEPVTVPPGGRVPSNSYTTPLPPLATNSYTNGSSSLFSPSSNLSGPKPFGSSIGSAYSPSLSPRSAPVSPARPVTAPVPAPASVPASVTAPVYASAPAPFAPTKNVKSVVWPPTKCPEDESKITSDEVSNAKDLSSEMSSGLVSNAGIFSVASAQQSHSSSEIIEKHTFSHDTSLLASEKVIESKTQESREIVSCNVHSFSEQALSTLHQSQTVNNSLYSTQINQNLDNSGLENSPGQNTTGAVLSSQGLNMKQNKTVNVPNNFLELHQPTRNPVKQNFDYTSNEHCLLPQNQINEYYNDEKKITVEKQTSIQTQDMQAPSSIFMQQPKRSITSIPSLKTCEPPVKTENPVDLPPETTPYIPPDFKINIETRHERYSTCSPLVDALTTAPERPFTPISMPTIERGSLKEALTIAPDRSYSPLPVNVTSQYDSTSSVANKTISTEIIRPIATQSSTRVTDQTPTEYSTLQNTGTLKSSSEMSAFRPVSKPNFVNPQSQVVYNFTNSEHNQETRKYETKLVESMSSQQKMNALNATDTRGFSAVKSAQSYFEQLDQKETMSLTAVRSKSGLHKPDNIPAYQKNFEQLPSQRGITPELCSAPAILQNPVNIDDAGNQGNQIRPSQSVVNNVTKEVDSYLQMPVQVALETRKDTPITMTFQPVNDDHLMIASPVRSRPSTPSLINKPAPIIPYYQMNLVTVEHLPPETRTYSPSSREASRSPTPKPRCKSPAPGPPPNPLKAHAPRIRDNTPQRNATHSLLTQATQNLRKEHEMAHKEIQIKELECDSKYLGQIQPIIQEHRHSGIAYDRETYEKGDTKVKKDTSVHQNYEQRQMQSQNVAQYGNTTVQTTSKTFEEFGRTQSTKLTEIRKDGSSLPYQHFESNAEISNTNTEPVFPPPLLNINPDQGSSVNLTNQNIPNAFNKIEILQPNPSISGANQNPVCDPTPSAGSSVGVGARGKAFGVSSAPKRGKGVLNKAALPGSRVPLCASCNGNIRGPFITALGRIWCPEHFICVNATCRRPLQDIGFVEESGQLYCEFCFEQYIAPACDKCHAKIKGDCLNAIGKHFHPECFNCVYCGKLFGNNPFFLEDGLPYCEADWNELFTTKCFACGFPVEAGDRWVEALNNNYHSQCFNCTVCKKNLEGQSFFAKGGRPFCKTHAR